MIKLNLQTFGGRGSAGGNNPARGGGRVGGRAAGTGRSTGKSQSEVSKAIEESRRLAAKGAPNVSRKSNKTPEQVSNAIGVARSRQLAASTARSGGARATGATQTKAQVSRGVASGRALANRKKRK